MRTSIKSLCCSLLSLLLLLSLLITPLGALPAAALDGPDGATPRADTPADQTLPYFQETGYGIANAQFADFFAKRGGLRTFGYPISRGFLFLGTQVQFFQRQIMQIRPDGSVGTLNMLDADLMPYTRINGSVFPATSPLIVATAPSPASPNYATAVLDYVRANAPDVWNGRNTNFLQTFLNTVKYEEAFPDQSGDPGIMPSIDLELWGVPTSAPAADPTNSAFIYLRFQRGIMHFDASSGATQGLLLADYLKSVLTGKNLPADLAAQAKTSRFYLQYLPGVPKFVARPSTLPGTDLTNAFAPQPLPTSAPKVAPPYDPTKLGYGMAVHLWYQDMPRVTGLSRDAGFGWVKQQIRWADVEPAQGQPDFSQLDKMVDAALGANQNLLFSVVSSPAWARADGRTNGPPDNLADYGGFVGTLAARYQGRVRAYEIWNEQNFTTEWGGSPINAGQYVELLKVGYGAIKGADPNALIVTGGLTPTGVQDPNVALDDAKYLEAMYQYQGGVIRQFSDAIGAHAGGYNNPPDDDMTHHSVTSTRFKNDPSFYFRRVEQLQAIMAKYGDASKKMWVTEFGWSTANPAPGYEYGADNSETDQATYLVRAFQIAKTTYPWMGVMFVWNLNFATMPDLPPTDEKRPFGIIASDWTPRPSYVALQAMPK